MQHALRVAVSNKAGSGKVSGSYVQHTSSSGAGRGSNALLLPAPSSHIKTLAQGSAGLPLPTKASIHCICFRCFPGTKSVCLGYN